MILNPWFRSVVLCFWSLIPASWDHIPCCLSLNPDLQTQIPGPWSCLQSLDSAGPREAVMWLAGTRLTADGNTVTLWVTVASCWVGTALSFQQEHKGGRTTWFQVLGFSAWTYIDLPPLQPVSSRRLLQCSIIWPKPKHKTPWADGFSVTLPGYWECNKNNTPSSCCLHLVVEWDSACRLKQTLEVLGDLRRRLVPPDGSDFSSDWVPTGRSRAHCTAAQPVGRLAHGLFSLSEANNPPKVQKPAGRSTKGNEGKTPEIPNHQNSTGIYSNYHPTRLHAIHFQQTVRVSAASR